MKKWCIFLCAGIVSVYSARANLLSNPSFETPNGTTDFAGSDWTAGGSAAPGRDYWAARSGSIATNKGGFMPGWSGANDGFVYQDVPVTTGTYTFSIWVRNEEGYTARTNEVRIGWYDASSNLLKESTSLFPAMTSDDLWHQLYVTGTCASQTLAFARATYYAAWGTGGAGGTAAFFDDADFHAGGHVSTPLANGSFERPTSDADNYWRASKWQDRPEGGKYAFESWANHSGAWGIGLWGWEVADPTNSVSIIQNLVPGTGTYTLAVYLKREDDFLLTNAQLRIQWFDRTFTNKVCLDTVTNLAVPNDFAWNEYTVAGLCESGNLYEARVSIDIDWLRNTNTGGGRALQIDDARFLPGLYNGVSLTEDWSYHNSGGDAPSVEPVPGTNVGAFLQVDYTTKSNTFYVMSPHDGFAQFAGEGGVVGMRTAWARPENGQFVITFADMERVGSLEIAAGSPFHGLPAVGTQTQDLWRYRMEFPRDTNGVYYTTNAITVFYSPYLRTTNEVGGETDRRYLVVKDAASTNNLSQFFNEAPENRDYSFQLNPPFFGALMDPGFEVPASNDFVNSPWTAFGGATRATWAARGGDRGGYFPSWSAGSGGLFQDVAATGGTQTCSIWIKRMLGASLNSMELKLEWYNTAAHLMFAETNTLTSLPADERWHRVVVTSTLPAGEAIFIRPVLFADYPGPSVPFPFHEAILFDDAELYSGGFTSTQPLVNGGFETGDTNGVFVASYWDAVLSDWVGRDSWAAHSGSWGGDFKGFDTNQPTYDATLSQGLNLSTGTYVFSAWIKAEDSIDLTNAEMRIEWLKSDFSDAQAATVQPLLLPLDNTWHFYAMTGTCGVADLFEVRPVVRAGWNRDTGPGNKAIMVDDVTFGPPGAGDADGDGLPDDWEQRWCLGNVTCVVANADQDGDGIVGRDEYILDYDPIGTSNEAFAVNSARLGSVTMTFGVTTNSRVYSVDYVLDLTNSAGWTFMGTAPGSNGVVTITDTNDAARRNYRVRVHLP